MSRHMSCIEIARTITLQGAALAPAVLAGIVLLATQVPAARAQPQTIFADNFNAETTSQNYTSFANWNVTRGSVDVLPVYGGFGQSVDMDGSTGAAGLLVTKTAFNLDPGSYTLSLVLGKNGDLAESMTVRVGNVFSQVITDSLPYPTPVTQTFSFNIASATTGAISFDHAGTDSRGFIIDDVSLVRTAVPTNPSAAPEPGSLALLLPVVGLAGMVIRKRRKR